MKPCPPNLEIHRLETFLPDDWSSVESVFAGMPAVDLGQAWLASPKPDLKPTRVRAGWLEDSLWVYAEMEDVDPFNPETRFNESFYMKGDVFEIFLRPEGQPAYFEFHVGPSNQLFQLRLPSSEIFYNERKGGIAKWQIPHPAIRTWAALMPGGWRVLAQIPSASIIEQGGSREHWLFSFSRYDYTCGAAESVHSSSSPHQKPCYHRQEEWGTLRFLPPGQAFKG